MTTPERPTKHLAALMRRFISANLVRDYPVIAQELEPVLTPAELRRAQAGVREFALVAVYSILLRHAQQEGLSLTPDQFHEFWAMAFKAAAERAELSPAEMDARWTTFNRALRSYVMLWNAVPQVDMQRHGVLFWARCFFADQVVECPVKPPPALKARHDRAFDAAGMVARDFEQAADEAFTTFAITV
jgi:hypothetical protein